MARDELPPGSSRLGWYCDGLPEQISPTRPVMLRNEDGQVTVTMLFGYDEGLHEYFYGPGDERTSHLDPPVPSTGCFHGPEGTIALAGGTYNPGTMGGTGRLGKIRFARAVINGSGLRYNTINGLATHVQFLQEWMGLSAPGPETIRDDDGALLGVRVTAEGGSPLRLSARLNLAVTRNFVAEPTEDGWWVRAPAALETSTNTLRPWADHAALHRRVCDLLTIAAGAPTGIQRVWASAAHDPMRTLDGRTHGPAAWLVLTQEFPEASTHKYPDFLFTFDDIGSRGVHRWINLPDGDFHGAMDAIRGLFRPKGTYLEMQFGLAALAVERVGHAVGVETGAWRKGEQPSFAAKVGAIAQVVPELGADQWITALNRLYRAHKHPDNPEPDVNCLSEMLASTKALLRAWIAVRLGCRPSDVVQRLGGPAAVSPERGTSP